MSVKYWFLKQEKGSLGLEYGISFSMVFIKSTAHATGLDPLLFTFSFFLVKCSRDKLKKNIRSCLRYPFLKKVTTVHLNKPDDQLMQHMQEGPIVYFICVFMITEFFKCSISLILIKIEGFK